MLDGLFIASLITSCYQAIKESLASTIPAENWANQELYHKDLMDGVPPEQRMKNLKNGKYRLPETQDVKYPKPHRAPVNGKIIIENNLLYEEDLAKYGAYQTHQWAKEGKYNLTSEELKKEEERIKKHLENLYNLK